MNKILVFLRSLIVPLIAFLLIPLLISIFNLFGVNLNRIVLIIISSVIMLISGFFIGKKSLKKGFVGGGILGLVFVVLLIILGLFFKLKFSLGRFIYYIILILSSMLGSIIGINKKKSN